MRELLLVLNTRAQSFLKRLSERRLQTISQNLSSVIVFGGFMIGVFVLSRSTTLFFLEQYGIAYHVFHHIVSLCLFVFFLLVNLGNMIVSFATLYKSPEVEFLLSLPISHAKIFLIKFVDNFFYSSTTLLLFGFAVLLGYGSVFDLHWSYYFFAMFFVLLPFMLIAGILAITTLMLLMRLGAKVGFRWLLLLIAGVYAAGSYFYLTVANPTELITEMMRQYPAFSLSAAFPDPSMLRFLPSQWVAEFFFWSILGEWDRAMPYFALLFLTMMGLIVLAGLIARRSYYESWLAVSDLRVQEVKTASADIPLVSFNRPALASHPFGVLFKRDFWLFVRDPSQWLHLLFMLLLLAMFLYSISNIQINPAQPQAKMAMFLVTQLFVGFLVASISLRFVFPLTSNEGESFWCFLTSPVSRVRLYKYKMMASFIIVFLIAEILAASTVYFVQRDESLILLGLGLAACTTLALVSLNLGVGSYFPLLRERNPIRVASSPAASMTFLASMAYLGVLSVLLALPLYHYFEQDALSSEAAKSGLVLPMILIALFSIVVASFSTWLGLKGIRRISG